MTPYYRHFGLERDPFLDTADPHFYRTTPDLTRVRERLVGGVLESRGLQVVIGDPGTGKTSLMAQIERELLGHDEVRLGKILDPSFNSETEFLLGVARSLGLALPPRSPAALKNALKNFLYDASVLDGLTLALLIDEAQNASDEIFEVLRLLLNYDVPQRKLLNVVLFGQTELRPRLDARRNLADRVDEWYELGPLDDNEARALIAYRIARAGGTAEVETLFDPDALAALVGAAAGTPRRLMTLSHAALREAAAFSRPRATRTDAEAAARSRRLTVPAVLAAAPAASAALASATPATAESAAAGDEPAGEALPVATATAGAQATGGAAANGTAAPWWRFPWLATLWPR